MKRIPAEISGEIERVWGPCGVSETVRKSLSECHVTSDGKYVLFEKPRMQTSFCYGYGYCGISDDEDRKRAEECRRAICARDRFIDANVNGGFRLFDRMMESPCLRRETSYDCPDGNLWKVAIENGAPIEDRRRFTYATIPSEDMDEIRRILLSERDKFVRRLNSYWNRYGSSKLKTWTYLCD